MMAPSRQQQRARRPYKLCTTQTCPAEQKCLTQGEGAADVCMIDTKIKGKCSSDTGCLNFGLGIACNDKKCYRPAKGAGLDEKCTQLVLCSPDLACTRGKCKKQEGSACTSKSECGLGLSCIDGKCKLSMLNGKCENHSDCVHGLICSSKHKVCKLSLARGAACDEQAICGNLKCYQGKCESPSFDTACNKEGAECPGYLICGDGKCIYRLATGDPCESNSQCEFGFCTNGSCAVVSGGGGCNHDVDCPLGQICGPSNNCCKSGDNGCF